MKSLKSLEHLPQLSAVKSLSAYSSGFEDISAIQNLPIWNRPVSPIAVPLKTLSVWGSMPI